MNCYVEYDYYYLDYPVASRCRYGKYHGWTNPYPSSYRNYRGSGQINPREKNTIANSIVLFMRKYALISTIVLEQKKS